MTYSLSSLPSTSPTSTVAAAPAAAALVRFVIDGLAATVDSFRAAQLPLHRFSWELTARITTLDELTAPPARRAVTRLRWISRGIAALHAELTAAARDELTAEEQDCLTATLISLHTALAQIDPHSPFDPAGAARPATQAPPVRVPRATAAAANQ